MAQRAVGRLFRCQNAASLRQSFGPLTQKRNYMKNEIPTFPPTSSAELDQALNRFREELFIPYGLTTQQRKLMSRQKYADQLEQEPITVAIGRNDEPFQLRPNNPLTRPTQVEAMEVICLMKTPQDWQNLLPFLAGLRMAHRRLNPNRWERLIRNAGKSDSLGIVLECAKRSEITGIKLSMAGLVKRIFFEIHRKAQRADFKGPEIVKALTLANQFAILMESPEHIEREVQLDPKRRPAVIGVLLELSAARALDEFGGKDVGGYVLTYAKRLLGTWSLGGYEQEDKKWAIIDQSLQENAPTYNAMKLALRVSAVAQDKSVSALLKDRVNQLEGLISAQMKLAPENVQQNPSLGYAQCQAFLKN